MLQKNLTKLSMKVLATIHNSYEDKPFKTDVFKPCTSKTFNSKQKIIERIHFLESHVVKPVQKPVQKPKVKRKTVISLANELLLHPAAYPYKNILGKIQIKFPEAKTNLNCLRWYATKLREAGHTIPARKQLRLEDF